MSEHLDRPPAEHHGAFIVTQITPDTYLESILGADYIRVPEHTVTEIHRHNHSDAVLYVTKGQGTVYCDEEALPVRQGDRIQIGRGVYHGFRTMDEAIEFVSLQSPPILDKKQDAFDRDIKIP
jgi:quercetin dioxygenase-like cupin family protein